MNFKVLTLGCKVNIYESEAIIEKMMQAGYHISNEEKADIIIINTCSVTNNADSKSRKLIRHIKRVNPTGLLVVCGCMIQNNAKQVIPAEIIIGNQDKNKIVDYIKTYLLDKKPLRNITSSDNLIFEAMALEKFSNHTRAFLKIQDGCNNYCSYCIIPFLRGQSRSKDFNEVISEAKTLVANNHQEIVLTGIHTGQYGMGTNHDIVDLINEISKIEKLKRIRISSLELTEINEKFILMLQQNKKVCDHLHIPLQSGSNKILKAMNRHYITTDYEKKIKEIRKIRKNISISTDVIVGFPGEDEECFGQTLSFCQRMQFSKIHVFPYSIRAKTKAASLPNQVLGPVKKQRAQELIRLSNSLAKNYQQKFINQELEVLIEETGNLQATGHTSNYLKVIINQELKKNTFYKIKIIKVDDDQVKGIISNCL